MLSASSYLLIYLTYDMT